MWLIYFLRVSIVYGHSRAPSGSPWRDVSVEQHVVGRGGEIASESSSALVALGSGAFANLTTNQNLIRLDLLYGEDSMVDMSQAVTKLKKVEYTLHNGTLRAYFAGAKRLWLDVAEWRRLRKETRALTWREQRIVERTPIKLARMLPILVNPLPPPFGFLLIGLASALPRLLLTPEFWTARQWSLFAEKDSKRVKEKYAAVLAQCLTTLSLVSRRVVRQQEDSDTKRFTTTPLKAIVEPFESGAPLALDVLSRKHLIVLARALPKPFSRIKLFFTRTSRLRAKLARLAYTFDQQDELLAKEFAHSVLDPRELFFLCAQRGLSTSGDHSRRAKRIQAWLDARAALLAAHGQSSLPPSFLLHMPALFSALIDHADRSTPRHDQPPPPSCLAVGPGGGFMPPSSSDCVYTSRNNFPPSTTAQNKRPEEAFGQQPSRPEQQLGPGDSRRDDSALSPDGTGFFFYHP